MGSINEESLMIFLCRTLVVENPQISSNVRTIEQILWQSYDGIEQVTVEQHLSDVAPAIASIAIKQRRAIQHNAYTRTCLVIHLGYHVLQEEQ